MIKVENDMLVLDSTFTKEDVKAIDHFVQISVTKERERILAKLEQEAEDNLCSCGDICSAFDNGFTTAISLIKHI